MTIVYSVTSKTVEPWSPQNAWKFSVCFKVQHIKAITRRPMAPKGQ